jgi:hypothetical protein
MGHTAGPAATCFTNQTCTVCGTVLAPAAHTPGPAATCTTAQTCTICGTIITAATGHTFGAWTISVMPTTTTTGIKEETCSVCGTTVSATIAKLVTDPTGTGSVTDLPELPDGQDYDLGINSDSALEINIETTDDDLYAVAGTNYGYKVELWITENGERIKQYDNDKTVNLSLAVPENIDENNFTLYRLNGAKLERVDPSEYTVEGRTVTLKTELPVELVFHEPEPEKWEMPWWLWVIIALSIALIIAIILLIVKKHRDDDDDNNRRVVQNANGSGASGRNGTGGGIYYGDILGRLDEHDRQISALQNQNYDPDGFYEEVHLSRKAKK